MAVPTVFGSKRDAATFDAAVTQIVDTFDLLVARITALKKGYAVAVGADFELPAMGGAVGTGGERAAARDALYLYVTTAVTGAATGQDIGFHLDQFRNVGR